LAWAAGAFCADPPRAGDLDGPYAPVPAFPYTAGGDIVHSIVIEPDGKILVRGEFSSADAIPCTGLVRFRPDGTLDRSFVADATVQNFGAVRRSLALQASGKIIVVDGQSAIRRLNSNGELDTAFSGYTSPVIYAVSVDSTQRVLVGGYSSMVRRTASGRQDTGFSAGKPDAAVFAVLSEATGTTIIAGSFTRIGSVSRKGLARLRANGSLDSGFVTSENPFAPVTTMALQADGKIVAGGSFGVARFNTNGSVDSSFSAVLDPSCAQVSTINDLVVQPDGAVLMAGCFSAVNGVERDGIARLNPDGSLDGTFVPPEHLARGGPPGIAALALQGDGKVLIGGSIASVAGLPRPGLARLNRDGTLDTAFGPSFAMEGRVRSVTVARNGGSVIGGLFDMVNGVLRKNVARLHPDGTVDPSFDPGLGPDRGVWAVDVQPGGEVIIAGNFTRVAGINRGGIARLLGNGSLDRTFNPGLGSAGLEGSVKAVMGQPDGRMVVSGSFTQFNGVCRTAVARLQGSGEIDPDYAPMIGLAGTLGVPLLASTPELKILIAGSFTNVNGWSRPGVARLNLDGSLDESFAPPNDLWCVVSALALQIDGKTVLAVEPCRSGQLANGFLRLNPDGTLDDTFKPAIRLIASSESSGAIRSQSDGKILVGGRFLLASATNTQTGIIRLLNDGSVDTSFIPVTTRFSGYVDTLVLGPGGNTAIVGGAFITMGQARSSIARVFLVARPQFAAYSRGADGEVQFTMRGAIDSLQRIDVSSDLLNWSTIGTILLTNASQIFQEKTAGPFSQQYFRAVVIPAP
jgi:uncharacterized delta-60 repeat protein